MGQGEVEVDKENEGAYESGLLHFQQIVNIAGPACAGSASQRHKLPSPSS